MGISNTVRREKRGHIMTLWRDRPEHANAVNLTLASDLAEAAVECDEDTSIKAVVLTATGRFFCAGGDVRWMSAQGPQVGSKVKRLVDDFHRAVSTFSRMQAPLIVAVNGVAAGAGFSLAMTGDLVLAAEDASFTMAYTNVGLSPDGSSTYFLPRLIGMRRTQELMLTNRTLSAPEALEWNLISKVTRGEELLSQAYQWAEMCAVGSGEAISGVKKLLMTSFQNGLETQMELEGRQVAACASSPNGQEGIRAFSQKQRPRFR